MNWYYIEYIEYIEYIFIIRYIQYDVYSFRVNVNSFLIDDKYIYIYIHSEYFYLISTTLNPISELFFTNMYFYKFGTLLMS